MWGDLFSSPKETTLLTAAAPPPPAPRTFTSSIGTMMYLRSEEDRAIVKERAACGQESIRQQL